MSKSGLQVLTGKKKPSHSGVGLVELGLVWFDSYSGCFSSNMKTEKFIVKWCEWRKSNKQTSTWAFHVSFFSSVFFPMWIHLGHFGGLFFFPIPKYICSGTIFFRLSRYYVDVCFFFLVLFHANTYIRLAAICLQVLVEDYLLSALKHTVVREWRDRGRESEWAKKAHTCHGESFFVCCVRQVRNKNESDKENENKSESDAESGNVETSVQYATLTIRNAPQVVHSHPPWMYLYVWAYVWSLFRFFFAFAKSFVRGKWPTSTQKRRFEGFFFFLPFVGSSNSFSAVNIVLLVRIFRYLK